MTKPKSARPQGSSAQRVFLETTSYRRRRLVDAARLLPLIAGVLFIFPALLAADGAAIAPPWIFLFSVWIILILATAILSYTLRRSFRDHPEEVTDGYDRVTGR